MRKLLAPYVSCFKVADVWFLVILRRYFVFGVMYPGDRWFQTWMDNE